MNATEAVAAIERLAEAGRKASPGEHIAGNMTIGVESRTDGLWEWFANGEGEMTNPGDAHFYAEAANARPALSALAGMCVLDVEVVRKLTDCARSITADLSEALQESMILPHEEEAIRPEMDRVNTAIAAADAELRRVEVRDA